MISILYNTDSYKGTHYLGYPANVQRVYSYLESRGGRYQEIPVLGIDNFVEMISRPITASEVEAAAGFWNAHVGTFNYDGWMKIVNDYEGRLPVEVYALPEGTVAKPGIPLVTITCTDPELPWLTSYLETVLLRCVWYPSTVAARIREMKKKIVQRFEQTADTLDNLPFALLDFSSRGTSSLETSIVGGYAYLTQFLGSDNVPAVVYTNRFYGEEMSGYSVAATEHSIMCAYGQENEKASFEYLLNNMVQPGGILSVVSDTWNIFRATELWGELAEQVKERDVKLVIRPDSGEPEQVIPYMLDVLTRTYGYTVNSKGYKVLNNVKILWGDGIDEDTCTVPFDIAIELGFSADNILVGSGGGLMSQDITRDTCKFAVKASAVLIDGQWVGISKNPITDPGKASKSGVFAVTEDQPGQWEWFNINDPETAVQGNKLQLVYSIRETPPRSTLAEIRRRAT